MVRRWIKTVARATGLIHRRTAIGLLVLPLAACTGLPGPAPSPSAVTSTTSPVSALSCPATPAMPASKPAADPAQRRGPLFEGRLTGMTVCTYLGTENRLTRTRGLDATQAGYVADELNNADPRDASCTGPPPRPGAPPDTTLVMLASTAQGSEPPVLGYRTGCGYAGNGTAGRSACDSQLDLIIARYS
jgi:hypothetical protein